jgi:glycosyltransferase involved in cell wall biosynthesis
MTKIAFAIPGDINLPTGGYHYDRRVLELLPKHGFDVSHLRLPGSYPTPSETDLLCTAELVAQTPADCVLLIDGLAYGAMPESLIAGFGRKIVALVHHPLCLETGLNEEREQELRVLEARALAQASAIIATSPATVRILADMFGVPASRLSAAVPGTDRAQRARGTGTPLNLLAVGSVVPRKGYDLLIEALQPYRGQPWTLAIAGGQELDRADGGTLGKQIEAAGLSPHIRWLGAVDTSRLSDLYDRADVFVMPSHYEGYGMAMTEALARGLAIVCTSGVPAADTIPPDAVIRIEAGNVDALTSAIGQVIGDERLRQNLSDAAWAAAQTLPTWNDTTKHIADVLRRVAR